MACGKYMLQNTDTVPPETTPPNTAVDVYINQWVQIRPFYLRRLLRNKIPAYQNQPFRMIQGVSRLTRTVAKCEIFTTIRGSVGLMQLAFAAFRI